MKTVTLSPELEALIRRRIDSGRFNSPDEVVSEALHLLDDVETSEENKLDALRAAIAAGEADAAAGNFSDRTIEDIIAEENERRRRRRSD
jgi:antitoxin ParD1/3/4